MELHLNGYYWIQSTEKDRRDAYFQVKQIIVYDTEGDRCDDIYDSTSTSGPWDGDDRYSVTYDLAFGGFYRDYVFVNIERATLIEDPFHLALIKQQIEIWEEYFREKKIRDDEFEYSIPF
jgi:hypothetical protein